MLPYDTLNAMNLLRVAITSLILFYSCITDWKSRRAPNQLWYVLGAAGLILNAYDFWASGFDTNFLLLFFLGVAFIYAFVYLIYRFGAFGGADAKALIAIAIVFPYYPLLDIGGHLFPVLDSIRSPIFALAVLGNAVLLPIAIVIAFAVKNLITVPLKEIASNPIALFTGYLMKIDQIKGKHVRIMHRYYEVDGKVQKKFLFGGRDADPETYNKLIAWQNEGKIGDKVWVTPKLPFLIPITMGFLIAVFYGDLLMLLMSFIIHR